VVTPNVWCSYVHLIRRIIEGKRNNKNRKKRNTRTTDSEPLHIIVLITTIVFLSYIYTHSYLY